MAKFSVVLCVVLVASMALAYDPKKEEEKKAALAVRDCVRSINRIFSEVARKYEETVKPITNVKTRDTAWEYYKEASSIFNELNAQVRNSKEAIRRTFVLRTFAGNQILCSDDVALEVYKTFYNAWDRLHQLGKSAGNK